MVDGDFSNGGQVIDFAAAARAAKDPMKLTAELFEEGDVSVAERPPSNPAPESDLVRNQVTSKAEVLRQGVEAMLRLSGNSSRDWADWLKVLAALGVGRHAAMLESGSNEPHGYKYCTAFSKWLRLHDAFQAIDQADRKRMFDCLDNLSAIEDWRARLAPAQRIKWNYPPTVLREWKKSQRPAPPRGDGDGDGEKKPPASLLAPIELRRQLEILGLDRFRREVLPPDWRGPLSDTALALASPPALIDVLERKFSTRNKDVRTALRVLKGFALQNA